MIWVAPLEPEFNPGCCCPIDNRNYSWYSFSSCPIHSSANENIVVEIIINWRSIVGIQNQCRPAANNKPIGGPVPIEPPVNTTKRNSQPSKRQRIIIFVRIMTQQIPNFLFKQSAWELFYWSAWLVDAAAAAPWNENTASAGEERWDQQKSKSQNQYGTWIENVSIIFVLGGFVKQRQVNRWSQDTRTWLPWYCTYFWCGSRGIWMRGRVSLLWNYENVCGCLFLLIGRFHEPSPNRHKVNRIIGTIIVR